MHNIWRGRSSNIKHPTYSHLKGEFQVTKLHLLDKNKVYLNLRKNPIIFFFNLKKYYLCFSDLSQIFDGLDFSRFDVGWRCLSQSYGSVCRFGFDGVLCWFWMVFCVAAVLFWVCCVTFCVDVLCIGWCVLRVGLSLSAWLSTASQVFVSRRRLLWFVLDVKIRVGLVHARLTSGWACPLRCQIWVWIYCKLCFNISIFIFYNSFIPTKFPTCSKSFKPWIFP